MIVAASTAGGGDASVDNSTQIINNVDDGVGDGIGGEFTEKSIDHDQLSLQVVASEIEEITLEEDKAQAAKSWSLVRKFAGITLTILASLSLSLGLVIVKKVDEISVAEMTTYRYIMLLLFSSILLIESGENVLGERTWSWRFWMLLRSLTGTTNIFLFYTALKYIPLADAIVFMLSVPVFVFIAARIILKEPFGRWHVLALIISLVGIALASNIDVVAVFGRGEGEGSRNGTINSGSQEVDDHLKNRLIGIALCMASIFSMTFVYISLRKIRHVHHTVTLFQFAVIGLLEMLIINSIWFEYRLPVQDYNAYLVMGMGVLSFFGQLLLTKATQFEEAGIVSVVGSSSDAAFAFVFQVTIFGEPLRILSILGAVLVLVSIFFLSWRKYVLDLPKEARLKGRFAFLD